MRSARSLTTKGAQLPRPYLAPVSALTSCIKAIVRRSPLLLLDAEIQRDAAYAYGNGPALAGHRLLSSLNKSLEGCGCSNHHPH